MEITRGGACPACGEPLAQPADGPAWCPECEWNLGVYDPLLRPPRGWEWLERRGHRLAFGSDKELLEEFTSDPPARPGTTPARAALLVVSLLFWIATPVCAVLGVVLVVWHRSVGSAALGCGLVLLALLFRPRLGRSPRRSQRLTRDRAPETFAVLDDVAAAVGVPPPTWLVLDLGDDASISQSGLRRRTTVRLGMRLWVTLGPQARVALLAHEFGHQVNGDPTRGLLVEPALRTFAVLTEWTGAGRTLGSLLNSGRRDRSIYAVVVLLALWLVNRVFLLVHVALSAIGLRDHNRAEYLADLTAVRVAGNGASIELMTRLVCAHEALVVTGYAAETDPPADWRALVDDRLTTSPEFVRLHEQLSLRQADLWSTHPPAGARLRLARRIPEHPPALELAATRMSRADTELSGWYRALHRRVLGTRDYRPRARKAADVEA